MNVLSTNRSWALFRLAAMTLEEFEVIAKDIPHVRDRIWRMHITSDLLARHPDMNYDFPVLQNDCSNKQLLEFMATIGQVEVSIGKNKGANCVQKHLWTMSQLGEVRAKFGVCEYELAEHRIAA